jgi:hypothetical protein
MATSSDAGKKEGDDEGDEKRSAWAKEEDKHGGY